MLNKIIDKIVKFFKLEEFLEPSDTNINSKSISLSLIKTPTPLLPLAIILASLIVIFILTLFLPWQQTITGIGKVTVFSPMDRPQSVNSQIDGKIVTWHVLEGDIVNKGDLLLEIEELNPIFLDEDQLSKLLSMRNALVNKRNANRSLINTLEKQIDSMTFLRDTELPTADLKILQTNKSFNASEQKLIKAEQDLVTAKLNFDRRKELFDKGLVSKRDFELAENAFVSSETAVNAARADLDIAETEINVSKFFRNKVSAETSIMIQDTEAKLAQSFEKLASIDGEIFDLDIKIANLENRVEQRKIYSPADGQIIRLLSLGSGETVNAGDQIAIIVPNSSDQAVEWLIDDFNAPLISAGRKARIQFAGFPALQFTGWPNVALGTFAGKVAVIDALETETGKFRVIIRPDLDAIKSGKEQAWPKPSNLRPGTNASGWIILDTVPLWFELWRQLNGFPPSLRTNLDENKRKESKLGAKVLRKI